MHLVGFQPVKYRHTVRTNLLRCILAIETKSLWGGHGVGGALTAAGVVSPTQATQYSTSYLRAQSKTDRQTDRHRETTRLGTERERERLFSSLTHGERAVCFDAYECPLVCAWCQPRLLPTLTHRPSFVLLL